MSLAEKLRAKTPMEIDKTEGKEGKRQAETEQAGSPHKRRPGAQEHRQKPKETAGEGPKSALCKLGFVLE